MEKIKGAFITNCILMAVCVVLMAYSVAFFDATYHALHSNDASIIAAFILLPLTFLACLATGIMGAIQVSISTRNIVKVRAWYTILMVIISCIFVVAPVVLILLLIL